jgi:hypothetical protein
MGRQPTLNRGGSSPNAGASAIGVEETLERIPGTGYSWDSTVDQDGESKIMQDKEKAGRDEPPISVGRGENHTSFGKGGYVRKGSKAAIRPHAKTPPKRGVWESTPWSPAPDSAGGRFAGRWRAQALPALRSSLGRIARLSSLEQHCSFVALSMQQSPQQSEFRCFHTPKKRCFYKSIALFTT